MNRLGNSTRFRHVAHDAHGANGGYVDETGKRLTALEATVQTSMAHLATKTELFALETRLVEKIGDVKSDLIEKIGEFKSDLVKWVVATGLGVVGVLVAIGGLAAGLAKYWR